MPAAAPSSTPGTEFLVTTGLGIHCTSAHPRAGRETPQCGKSAVFSQTTNGIPLGSPLPPAQHKFGWGSRGWPCMCGERVSEGSSWGPYKSSRGPLGSDAQSSNSVGTLKSTVMVVWPPGPHGPRAVGEGTLYEAQNKDWTSPESTVTWKRAPESEAGSVGNRNRRKVPLGVPEWPRTEPSAKLHPGP